MKRTSPRAAGFPESFLWGAATSAYQIEGSPLADGAGPSNWHHFSHTPGRTEDGAGADLACDHYRRYAEDVELMRTIGLRAYRFSISWSRVLPEGRGALNAKGLGFYDRLVDALLAAGIQPFATLFHWDFPAALDHRGGWLNPDSASWFADYARAAFRALGDRVTHWATINEPWVVMDAGYLHGVHAPGHRSLFEAPIVAHHLLRAHAAAVEVFRAEASGSIGLVVNLEPKVPASDSPSDLAATGRSDAYWNRYFLDPVFFGAYPPELAELFGAAWPRFSSSEIQALRQPIDFVGVNYYKRAVIEHDPEPKALPPRARGVRDPARMHTDLGWEVCAEALTDTLTWVRERYGEVPLYVTENGAAFYDPPRAIRGRVDDPLRIEYLREHLLAAREAIARGVDLRGFFVWSLLDNLEWASGTAKRFGLVHVDHVTRDRTLKESARFYRRVIDTNGRSLDE